MEFLGTRPAEWLLAGFFAGVTLMTLVGCAVAWWWLVDDDTRVDRAPQRERD